MVYSDIDINAETTDVIGNVNGTSHPTYEIEGPQAVATFESDGSVGRGGIVAFYYVNAYNSSINYTALSCPFNCWDRGDCVQGRCICYRGFMGGVCENDDLDKVRASKG